MRFLFSSVFLVSAVGIAYQISLMRVFAVGQWHHFAYMVISNCMLGFAAAGTLLSIFEARVRGRESRLFQVATVALVPLLPVCYAISQQIPFETFRIAVEPGQLGYLLLLYLTLSPPFFLVSAVIALAFRLKGSQTGKIYAVNMAGSGLGAVLAVLLFYAIAPRYLALALMAPAAIAAVLALGTDGKRSRNWWLVPVAAASAWLGLATPVRVSEYKGLSHAMRLPDAEILAVRNSPLAQVTVVSSQYIRETPGQISNYPMATHGPLPPQLALFFDAGGSSVIHRFDGNLAEFAFLDHVTGALPYRFLEAPRVLVIGAGGGTDVLAALAQGASQVTAVEVDPHVVSLLKTRFRDFSGNLYGRPDVTPVLAEGRGFLETTGEEYDLIQISLLDSFNASAAGVYALSESYLYTRQALRRAILRLSPGGVLAVTRWLKTPPRDAIKLCATMIEAAESAGFQEPGKHLAMVRSWNTATLVFSRSPLSSAQIAAVREFCGQRQLDLCWLPGLAESETNRFTVLDRPYYYLAAKELLGPGRQAFYRDSLFEIRPATDDRPYFFQFFKWRSFWRLIQNMGTEWIPFVEWGYLALCATLVQALFAGLVLVCLPWILSRRKTGVPLPRGSVIVYFSSLGFAFMFLEMVMIQRFMLFLSYPVLAVSVVLAALLLFAGMGSLFADRPGLKPHRLLALAVAMIGGLHLLYLVALPELFQMAAGSPTPLKIVLALALLAPPAFFMGIPFPVGFRLLAQNRPPLLPWAWSINGSASVLGAVLGAMAAIHFGFTALTVIAIGIYLLAIPSFHRLLLGLRPGAESTASP